MKVFYDGKKFYKVENLNTSGSVPTCSRGREIDLGRDQNLVVISGLSSPGWSAALRRAGYERRELTAATNSDWTTSAWFLKD